MAQQALLVVDMQQAFDVESRWGRRNNPDCEANVVALIEASQRRGEPVVFVRHDSVEADSLLRPSEPGNRFKPELEHIEPDLLVSKSVHSSFHGEPDLDRWLRSRGIDSVVICGIATDHCCETTARLACDLGYRVSFPLDATLTFDRQDLQGQTITADEIARVTAASLAGEFAEITTTAALLAGQSRPSLNGDGVELDLSTAQRAQLWTQLQQMAEAHLGALEELPVAPATSESLRERVEAFDFAEPVDPAAALDEARRLLTDGIVHTGHPRYFGLFNPAPTFMGIAADALVAAFNPQLAAASHAPAAVEVERHLVRYLGTRFGLPPDEVAGSFTSGGAEANFTAVLVALTKTFPQLADDGLRSLPRQPVLYASQQSHLAVSKIAHAVGLGRHALRLVPTDDALALDVPALEEQIARDRAAGEEPFMVLATAGTTAAGIIDPLPAIAQLCQQEKLYFHVDAAWGGAAIFSPRLSPALAGIEAADSITFDSHKWLSVPMGAGMFIGRDADALAAAFAVTTGFMPAATDLPDPYVTSAQWSRRFIGLKVLLSLVVAGSDGYARQIEADCGRADLLRARLAEEGWDVINRTPLPVICFVDGDAPHDAAFHQQVATAVIDSGEAWISAADLGHITALRACMISHRTRDEHVEQLAAAVGRARQRLTGRLSS